MAAEAWIPDLLGAPFEQRTLPLGEDAEGELVATLVRSLPGWRQRMLAPLNDVDVLYVHGWSDFFFQTELARAWNDLGARFYALDLRKYGRSLRDGQAPGYVDSLDTYDADIAAALAAMGPGDQPSRRLVLLGHSTGGLVLTLWSARNPGRASALILNSPWLELQTGALARQALSPVLRAHARVAPLAATPAIDMGFYARAQGEVGSLPNLEGVERWRPAAALQANTDDGMPVPKQQSELTVTFHPTPPRRTSTPAGTYVRRRGSRPSTYHHAALSSRSNGCSSAFLRVRHPCLTDRGVAP